MKKHLSIILVLTVAGGTLAAGDGSSSDEETAQLRNPGQNAHPKHGHFATGTGMWTLGRVHQECEVDQVKPVMLIGGGSIRNTGTKPKFGANPKQPRERGEAAHSTM